MNPPIVTEEREIMEAHDPDATPPTLGVDERVALCESPTSRAIPAMIERCEEDSWTVRFDGAGPRLDVGIFLRAFSENGQAWGVPVDGERQGVDGDLMVLRRVGAWAPVFARTSARVTTHAIVMAENSGTDRIFRLMLLDISGSGCRVNLVGRTPEVGDVVRLIPDGGSSARIPARVMRVDRFAFGRAEIGLRFEMNTPTERFNALAWRDRVALGALAAAGG